MALFADPQEPTYARQLILASGTAANPSLIFANDPANGLYWDVNGIHLTNFTPTTTQSQPASVVIPSTNIDWSLSYTYRQTLGANTTFTFSNQQDGMTIIVALTNTASNWTVTWPTVAWSGGTPPTQTVGVHTDVYTFVKMDSVIYGSVVQNF